MTDKRQLLNDGYHLLYRKDKESPNILYKIDDENDSVVKYYVLDKHDNKTTETPFEIDRAILKSMSLMDFEVN